MAPPRRALHDGVPFKALVLPGALAKVRRKPKGVDHGDRQMVGTLAAARPDRLARHRDIAVTGNDGWRSERVPV